MFVRWLTPSLVPKACTRHPALRSISARNSPLMPRPITWTFGASGGGACSGMCRLKAASARHFDTKPSSASRPSLRNTAASRSLAQAGLAAAWVVNVSPPPQPSAGIPSARKRSRKPPKVGQTVVQDQVAFTAGLQRQQSIAVKDIGLGDAHEAAAGVQAGDVLAGDQPRGVASDRQANCDVADATRRRRLTDTAAPAPPPRTPACRRLRGPR